MYFLYNVLSAAGMILLAPYFLIRGLRQKKYLANLGERFGFQLPPAVYAHDGGARRAIWIHAVSVGEVLAALPLARCLKERFPDRRLVISTTTATGQRLAHERMTFADAVFYFPFDWPGPIKRVFEAVRPGLIIICETEIWPNFLRQARRAGAPVVFVNGRLSNRSFRGFSLAARASAGALGAFLRRILSDAALYLMQSEQDAARLIALGAPADRVVVTGNMKHDQAPAAPGPFVGWLADELVRSDRGPVLVAGSVLAGEEAPVLEALEGVARRWPRALLILAPRKPERFSAAAALIEQAGWRVVRRSALSLDGHSAGALGGASDIEHGAPRSVLLLDTIGELAAVYSLGDAVFIGGSLEPAGGHNPLEPAAFGKPPVFGPSMENFRNIAAGLLAAKAAIQVRSGTELGETWSSLLGDASESKRLGEAAREFVERSRGATAATLERVAAMIESETGSRIAGERARS
jgi:3-deoxy-D-manno-octulosonic-acid transferase